jgi:hypothetical protein
MNVVCHEKVKKAITYMVRLSKGKKAKKGQNEEHLWDIIEAIEAHGMRELTNDHQHIQHLI